MKYLKASFENYIGFSNGMGLDNVEIDFTKCRNNIILIKGMNGTGKSTLLNSLNLFPDPSTSFVPMKNSSKKFTLFSNGDIYDIQIYSPADVNGGRKVSKAYIQKNGLELNSNGNISSYKDILFSEFELDSNFLSLTKLSNDAKGLGGLTPSERKKFASSIIENLDVYNEMYKTLNKKSSIYKSHINGLHTKIQNIGSKENIEVSLKGLRAKEHEISVKIMELNNRIVTIQAKSTIDESEMQKINKLNSDLNNLLSEANILEPKINILKHKLQISETEIDKVYEQHLVALKEYESNSDKYKAEWVSLSDRVKSNADTINLLRSELESYNDENDANIEEQYNASKKIVLDIENKIKSLGFTYNSNSIIYLSSLLEFFSAFCKDIDAVYHDSTLVDMKYISSISYNYNKVSELQARLNDNFAQSANLDALISDLRQKIKIASVIEKRPSNCKIDSCPFINEAVKLTNESSLESMTESLAKLQTQQLELTNDANAIQELIDTTRIRDMKRMILDRIITSIEQNKEKIKMFNIQEVSSVERFLSLVSQNNPFNNLRDPKVFIELLNDFKVYSSELSSYNLLKVQYDSYRDKIKMMNSNRSMLDKLTKDQEELLIQVEDAKHNYTTFKSLRESFSIKVADEKQLIDLLKEYKTLEISIEGVKSRLDDFNEKSSKAVQELSEVNKYKEQIDLLTKENQPISNEISRLTGQLTMLDSYYKEYEEYNEKFNLIETRKKYCSPTSGGIQVLFMQLYMSKTLDLSNQILSLLFNGEYRLLDFVINQNEFRIPFVGNGLPVDDISSGSSSQVCMMSMIINLVLLHQASTKFNIARLDEIDDSLDTYNRANFVNVLYRILPLLNIEQLFIISHSIELDSSAADIIKLKSYNDYESNVSSNVIWDYEEVCKTL